MFRRVQLAALQRDDELVELDPDVDWPSALDTATSSTSTTRSAPGERRVPPPLSSSSTSRRGLYGVWRVEQIIDDPAGDHDWRIRAEVDLAASEEEGTAIVRVTEVLRGSDSLAAPCSEPGGPANDGCRALRPRHPVSSSRRQEVRATRFPR